MELDKRIIDRKYIYDCFNADMAKEFSGEDCYMTNDIELFQNLDRINVYKLDRVEDGFYNVGEDEYFDFCLPVRWVKPKEKEKEKEKKYRPFTMEEFNDLVEFGEFVSYRQKDKAHTYCVMYVGNQYTSETEDNPQEDMVGLGPYYHSFEELLADYEWLPADQDKWVPFGVEVEE